MVRKGNLLYNGGFETGTPVEWIFGDFGLQFDYTHEAETTNVYQGNYAWKFGATKNYAKGYISYDKICSFEEHEAYLFIGHVYLEGSFIVNPVVYGLDDNGNLLRIIYSTDIKEQDKWVKFMGILRGIGEITHFKVGLYMFAFSAGYICYVDEFKLIPLKNIRSHIVMEEIDLTNLTANTQYFAKIFMFGNCKLRSSLRVEEALGDSPTLDTTVSVFYNFSGALYRQICHSQFTDTGLEEIVEDIGDALILRVDYKVGGTNPNFSIKHRLALEPMEGAIFTQGGAL